MKFNFQTSQNGLTNDQHDTSITGNQSKEIPEANESFLSQSKHDGSLNMEEMGDIDLGSSFSQSIPSQNKTSEIGYTKKDVEKTAGKIASSQESKNSGSQSESSGNSKFRFKTTKGTVAQLKKIIENTNESFSNSDNDAIYNKPSTSYKAKAPDLYPKGKSRSNENKVKVKARHSMSDSSPECERVKSRVTGILGKDDWNPRKVEEEEEEEEEDADEDQFDPPTDVSMNVSTLSDGALRDDLEMCATKVRVIVSVVGKSFGRLPVI